MFGNSWRQYSLCSAGEISLDWTLQASSRRLRLTSRWNYAGVHLPSQRVTVISSLWAASEVAVITRRFLHVCGLWDTMSCCLLFDACWIRNLLHVRSAAATRKTAWPLEAENADGRDQERNGYVEETINLRRLFPFNFYLVYDSPATSSCSIDSTTRL